MNFYLRFFDDEVLVENADQAIEFLASIPDIRLDDYLAREVRNYVEGDMPYPKRFKVSPRSYFIMIKTTATSMEDFKSKATSAEEAPKQMESEKEMLARTLSQENPGWYKVSMLFKRVIPAEGTGKFQYVDTKFEVKLKAHSIQESYDMVVDHLRTRNDVDPRSQFPSIKGRNFQSVYLGMDACE